MLQSKQIIFHLFFAVEQCQATFFAPYAQQDFERSVVRCLKDLPAVQTYTSLKMYGTSASARYDKLDLIILNIKYFILNACLLLYYYFYYYYIKGWKITILYDLIFYDLEMGLYSSAQYWILPLMLTACVIYENTRM